MAGWLLTGCPGRLWPAMAGRIGDTRPGPARPGGAQARYDGRVEPAARRVDDGDDGRDAARGGRRGQHARDRRLGELPRGDLPLPHGPRLSERVELQQVVQGSLLDGGQI